MDATSTAGTPVDPTLHPVKGSRTPNGRGDRRINALITAARELFDEYSLAEVSVAMISCRAGLTRSNFYHYFDSKHAILAELLADAVADFQTLTDAQSVARETPQTFITDWLRAAQHVFDGHRRVLSLCLTERDRDPQIKQILDSLLRRVGGMVVAALGTHRDGDELPPGSDEELACMVEILLAATTLAFISDAGLLVFDHPSERIESVLKTLWLRGLWNVR